MPDICDSEMVAYGTFQPTGFDPRGLGAHRIGFDEDDSAWLVAPVSQTRDSEALTRSNFRVAVRSLESVDPDGVDPGWYEIILVRPGSKAHTDAWEMECSLADYPILDESDWSELEYEEREDEEDED
jgi:hypothetical protein